MSLSEYLLGAAELAVIAAALGLGAYYLRARILPGWSGAPARLAEIVLALSALVLISELLGAVGLFKEVPLLMASALVGVATALWARGQSGPPVAGEQPESSTETDADQAASARSAGPGWLRALPLAVAAGASLLVVAHWAVPTQNSLDVGMYFQDTVWYHMSFSGRFAQEGLVGPLHLTDPLKLATWFYPQNSELLHGVGMVAFDNDVLSPLVNLGWLALALLSAWCIGRPYAVGAATLVGAAVVLDSEMMVATQAGNAPNDIAGLACLLAAIALLITGRVAASAQSRAGSAPAAALAGIGTAPLLIAGLAAGLGAGTKITLLAPLGIITLGIPWLAEDGKRLRALGVWVGGMALTAGFWFIRNVVTALNPIPWLDKLGPIDLPGPEQLPIYPREPHRVMEYLTDTAIWGEWFVPVFRELLGPFWMVILAVTAVALVVAVVRAEDRLMRLLAITGIIAGLVYLLTPLTASGDEDKPSGFLANLRYVAPALIIAFTLLPTIPDLRKGRRPLIVLGVLALLLVVGPLRPKEGIDIELSPTWSTELLLGASFLAAVLVLVPLAAILAAQRGARTAAIAIPLVAFAGLVALGYDQQRDYLRDRYRVSRAPEIGGFRGSDAWKPLQDWGRRAHDERIGVFGRGAAFGQYVFYGNDLSNHVQYIGDEGERGTLRPIRGCRDWRRIVNEGDYDFVVTTPPLGASEFNTPLEDAWMNRDPAVRKVVDSGTAAVFEINGELDPSACAKLPEELRNQ